ncbi:DUF7519 family protein [Natronobacterium texcoconense]|uniref:Uncharacterized protein n=1 Tax=Natronobacterium texcoconense TaxID=1095778 RepID=A0A1H1J2X2_NATTX|nr:hypothetical protein [Natronobacterium texcoconense]SDR43946.1 hypothetical protein SAMN04489842_4029 [Natronobacterium texcoconense]
MTATTKRSERDDQPNGTISAPVTAIVTMLATAVGAVALAVGVDALEPAAVAAVAGCLLTATVTATKRRTPGGRAVGSVLVVFAATAMTGAIGFAAVSGPIDVSAIFRVGVALSVGLAAFGATATLTGAVGDGAVRSAVPVAVFTAVPIAVAAAVYAVPVRATWDGVTRAGWTAEGRVAVERFLSPDGTAVGVVTFLALFVGLLWTAYVVLPRLPIPQLLPRDRREPAQQRIRRLALRTGIAGMFVLLAGTAATGVLFVPALSQLPYVESVIPVLESVLVPVAMAPAVRIGVVGAIVTLWLVWLLSRLPGLRRLRHGVLVSWGPVFTGGVLVASLVASGYPTVFEERIRPELEAMAADGPFVVPQLGEVPLEELLEVASPPEGIVIASVVIVGIVGSVVALLLGIWATGLVRLLPTRGAPGALGAGALVGGTIVAAAGGASPFVVCIAVAAAVVAWDAAVYGVSITEELGRDTNARMPALAHTTGTVLVGAVGVGVALAVPRLVGAFAVRTGITVALSLTVALLAVFVALKRRANASRTVDAGGLESDEPSTIDESQPAGDSDDATPEHPTASDSEDGVQSSLETDAASLDLEAETVPTVVSNEAETLRVGGFETIGDLQSASASEIASETRVTNAKARLIVSAVDDEYGEEE